MKNAKHVEELMETTKSDAEMGWMSPPKPLEVRCFRRPFKSSFCGFVAVWLARVIYRKVT